MTSMSIDHYIEDLTLSDANYRSASRSDLDALLRPKRSGGPGPRPTGEPFPADLQAAVDAGSLLSFVEGVSTQERDDALYSVQLAQRDASGAFDRFTQTESWYRKYTEILEHLGWAAEQLAFARFEQSEGDLRMDGAALAIITAIATQNQLAVLQEAVSALEALAEDDDRIRLFDFHTCAEASGNFQIGAAQKADNGALSLAIGAFHFPSLDARRRFLFFSWGARDIELWTAAQKMTLNADLYANHREAVARKLAASATDFIAALELA
jgi:hypothetical protein